MASQADTSASRFCGQIFFKREGDAEFSEERVIFFQPPPVDGQRDYLFYTRNLPNWNGTITEIRLDPACGPGVGGIRINQFGLIPQWTFESSANGWVGTNNAEWHKNLDGGAIWIVTGGDPNIASPSMVVPADEFTHISLELASQADTRSREYCGQVFYRRNIDTSFSGEQVRFFRPPPYNGEEKFLFEMGSQPNWSGNTIINQLRLDPACGAGDRGGGIRLNEFALLRMAEPNTEMVINGGFGSGFANWLTYDNIDYEIRDGAVYMRRDADRAGRYGRIQQYLGRAADEDEIFEVKLDIANVGSETTTVSVILSDADDTSDRIICDFRLAGNTPSGTYTLRGVSTNIWEDMSFFVHPAETRTERTIRVDNISVKHLPDLEVSDTVCLAPEDETPTEGPTTTTEAPTEEPTATATDGETTATVEPTTETPTEEPTATTETPTEPTPTGTPAPPVEPVYPLPDATVTETAGYNPRFQWNVIEGAEWYHLYIALEDYSTVVLNAWFEASAVCEGSICTLPEENALWLNNGDYIWWIGYWSEAIGDGYTDTYASTTFTINMPAPANVTGVAPSSETTDTSATVQFTADPGTLWYQIWVGLADYSNLDGNLFGWFRADAICSDGTCSVAVPGTLAAGEYIIWMQQWGPGGFPDWYEASRFTITAP